MHWQSSTLYCILEKASIAAASKLHKSLAAKAALTHEEVLA
jgi:hypothetical protein